MTPIESGTTTWWRNRNLMFLVLFLAAAGWFAYDGYVKYPAKNREWVAQIIGVPPAEVNVNPLVRGANVKQLGAGLKGREAFSLEQLTAEIEKYLGKPSLVRDKELWWVGPTMYLRIGFQDGRLTLEGPVESKEYIESHIQGQKWFAALLLVLAGLVFLNLVRILRTRVVLDDTGLRYNQRHVSWEAMTGLRTQDYNRKFWVDIEYTADSVTRSLRLDSFHIEKFKEIVGTICERKGFSAPAPAAANESAGDGEDAGHTQP